MLDGRVPWLVFILEFTRILAQVVELRPRCFNELEAATADRAEWRPSEAQRIIRLAKDHPVALFPLCELATQRVFGKSGRGSDVEQIQNRGQNVGRLYLRLHHCRLPAHRQLDEQGHMGGRIIEKNSMGLFTVFPEPFAMIANHDDQRTVVSVLPLQVLEKMSQRAVGVGDLAIVRTMLINLREGWRRIVRIMRIVEVHPNEPWFRRMTVHPCFGAMDYIFAAALHATPMLAFTGV